MESRKSQEVEVLDHGAIRLSRSSDANDRQVGGNHYKGCAIEPWDYIAANGLGFFEGNIVKYITRWKFKGDVADLRKAQHYLEKLIELSTPAEDEPENPNEARASDVGEGAQATWDALSRSAHRSV